MTNTHTVHLMEAIAFAADKHRHQRRKDKEASPYINHPIALAHLLVTTAGVEEPVVLQAAILHDTIEDTQTSYAELLDRFGKEVADAVAEVTDDKSLPKERRKELQVEHAPHASRAAALVKLADKICNLRDMAAARRSVMARKSPDNDCRKAEQSQSKTTRAQRCNFIWMASGRAIRMSPRHRPRRCDTWTRRRRRSTC